MNIEIRAFKQPTAKHYQLLLSAEPSKAIVEASLKRAYGFEARIAGELGGVLLLLETRPQTLELVNLAVTPELKQQGIGTQLVKFGINWAKDHQYATLVVGTGTTSFVPLYLYQKCGFRAINIEPDYFVKHYSEPIIENGLVLKDMVRLQLDLK
ncbi:GNAT family N-acetyltransferase [Agrilactobacillus yilanensis]|uniref:GNAT family N-acetyltransferase n=1 Tax=Agrilactobacillus yilanensis TaxID=2485997 RepID=A0ABW4J337_9LACO|nr:GNAT family N-acetyltransferase [Agrilactobacillus yilanensis]